MSDPFPGDPGFNRARSSFSLNQCSSDGRTVDAAARDPSLDFRWLRQKVGVRQVLSAYRLDSRLRERGEHLCGPCPLHGGDNPTAFRANLSRDIWRCFTHCGGGDVVELIRVIERCSYRQAAIHLRGLVQGVSPPEPVAPSAPSTNDGRRVPFKPFRRCISLDPHTPFLQQDKGITARTASRFEAGTPHHRSSFLRGTIAVRLHDMSGQPIGYCGRRLQHDEIARWGKWRFPPRLAKAEILYNAHRALPARASGVVVVECPWGVMRLAQAGCASPVALLGTSLSTHQAHWLQAAPAVLLLLDGDQAGRHAAARIAQQLSPLTTVRSCSLPEGYDPDDLTDSQLAALVAATIPSSLNQHTYESGNRSTP